MVGVPALTWCMEGPSSRICCPILRRRNHPSSAGVPSTASQRAIPPESIRLITGSPPAARSPAVRSPAVWSWPAQTAGGGQHHLAIVEGDLLVADLDDRLVALPGQQHHVARAGGVEHLLDGPAPVSL